MAAIGIGVIGCGDIARVRYFPSIAALPEFELTAVYSRTPDACRPIVARHSGKLHTTLEAFLGDPNVEAVVVATPHPTHADLSIRALAAGKHVLTEKPMATSIADSIRLCRAAEQSGRVFVALPFDSYPAVDAAKRLIQGNAIGTVSSADAVLAHSGPSHAPWFFNSEGAGWGVLADLGVYLISQLIYLFGPANTVVGRVTTVFPERISEGGVPFKVTVDDNVAAVIGWRNDFVATIRSNWCSPADKRNVICETRIYGTDGIIFINLASATDPLVVYSPTRAIDGATAITYNGLTECYRVTLPAWNHDREILLTFARAIAGLRTASDEATSAVHQHHVIEIISRLYESSTTGRVLTLKSGGD